MAANQMIDGSSDMPPNNPMVNNIANMNPPSTSFHGRFDGNGTIDPNMLAIQQMRALEGIGWKGGDQYYDGPHDDFCFVCGSAMELVGCQTCDNCYHPNCMTPSLDPNDVPSFWFCPHCVNNELHIPRSSDEHFVAPLPTSLPHYPSSLTTASSEPSMNTPVITKKGSVGISVLESPSITEKYQQPVGQQPAPPSQDIPSAAKSRPQEPAELNKSATHKKPGQPRHSSPPRKKSKYSAFSKEVDKALSVIYGELEAAAGYGRSEGNLQSVVQALEQQLKMQEGQIMLNAQEMDFARKELRKEREESAVLKVDNFEIQADNARLKGLVDRKENELTEWRTKLRSMIGSDMQ